MTLEYPTKDELQQLAHEAALAAVGAQYQPDEEAEDVDYPEEVQGQQKQQQAPTRRAKSENLEESDVESVREAKSQNLEESLVETKAIEETEDPAPVDDVDTTV